MPSEVITLPFLVAVHEEILKLASKFYPLTWNPKIDDIPKSKIPNPRDNLSFTFLKIDIFFSFEIKNIFKRKLRTF